MKFPMDSNVRIVRLGGEVSRKNKLEGRTGVIAGKSYDEEGLTIYIVVLDEPYMSDDNSTVEARAVTITEHCLEYALQ